MSNYDINIAVAKKLGIRFNFDKYRIYLISEGYFRLYNPCGNLNDSMKLSKQYKISITWDERNVGYTYITNGQVCVYTNDLERGICEVFLMTDYKIKYA